MTATATAPAPALGAALPAEAASGAAIPKINPATGLSTDYLNHFTEAIMVLEMISVMPDCLPDFLAWEPRSYREHFAASRFSDRDAVIAAYDAADPALRQSLDTLTDIMNTLLLATREAIASDASEAKTQDLSQRAVNGLKPLITRAGAVINGTALSSGISTPQNVVDALFDR